jgi:hypothetical protein
MSRYFFAMQSDCEWPFERAQRNDYDRINPVRLMLSNCDLAIIDRHKSEGQDVRDFLQRLISENLRVMRDRTP